MGFFSKTSKSAEGTNSGARVKILGPGCKKCDELEKNTKEALKELGMSIEVDHVKSFSEIASFGVMTTPALVVDGKVVSIGKVLRKDEIIKKIKDK